MLVQYFGDSLFANIMTEVTNDLPDVAQFLYSQNEMAECLSYENVIQSSDDFLFEAFEKNVDKASTPKQTIHLIDQDLSIDPGSPIVYRLNNTLCDTGSMESDENTYPGTPSSCNITSTPQLLTKEDEIQGQQVIRSTFCSVISPPVSHSNGFVYESLSSVVR